MDGENSREYRIDGLKGIAIAFVVLGHVLLGYTENYAFPADQNWMLMLKEWIYAWHMPLFFAISGATFSLSILKKDGFDAGKCRKQVLNLLMLYVVFSIVLGTLKILFASYVDNPMTFGDLLTGLLFPINLMWYLWVLIPYYFVYAIFRKYLNLRVMLAAGMLCLIAGQILEATVGLPLCLRSLLRCFVFFTGGIMIQKGGKVFGRKTAGTAAWAVFLLASIGYVWLKGSADGNNPVIVSVLEQILAFSVIIALFYAAPFPAHVRPGNGLVRLGTGSLVIYLVHTYFVTAIKVLVIRSGFQQGALAAAGTWIVSMALSFLIYLLSRRVRWIGMLFRPIGLVERHR